MYPEATTLLASRMICIEVVGAPYMKLKFTKI